MKKIFLIATGGTIVSKIGKNGLTPQIQAEELLQYVPQCRKFCEVETLQLMNLDSTNMCPRDWEIIAGAIRSHYEDFDGFVICHGTDTLAFTAAVLSYMIQNSPKPVVLTGSQKPIDLEITDARTNLADSLLYASDDDSSGVSIVFDGKVIAGTRAKKCVQRVIMHFLRSIIRALRLYATEIYCVTTRQSYRVSRFSMKSLTAA